MHWQILAALVLSTLTALVLRLLGANAAESGGFLVFVERILSGCGLLGDLFLRALKLIILPLIVTSVVSGIASLQGVRGFGRLGLKTAAYYAASSLVAILIGLFLVNLIQPGLVDGKPNGVILQAFEESGNQPGEADREVLGKIRDAGSREWDSTGGLLRSMLPENVMAAASDNGRILGVIVFSILFSVALTRIPYGEMQTVQQFFKAANDAMIIITGWIMLLAPIGVYALILPVVYKTGGELFLSLGKYFFTVLLALLLHALVVLPCVLRWIAKVDPWAHLRAMRESLMLAFSTASSSGTLPVTLRCIEQAGVSKRVSSFTVPLGATVNMDGTALYECVAVIFVAQVMGVELGFAAQFGIVVAALLTSVGVAGVPAASLVAILLILKSSQIPGAEAAVAALLAVDRLLDMSRTAVNVFSDSCAAVFVAKSEGEALPALAIPARFTAVASPAVEEEPVEEFADEDIDRHSWRDE